jgi:hypothetical protein
VTPGAVACCKAVNRPGRPPEAAPVAQPDVASLDMLLPGIDGHKVARGVHRLSALSSIQASDGCERYPGRLFIAFGSIYGIASLPT